MKPNSKTSDHSKQIKQQAVNELLDRTRHDTDFYVLLLGSIAIAAFAIFNDSIPVLIASMIVAPLATPILTLGLGITAGHWPLVRRAFGLLCTSSLIALLLAVGLALIFDHNHVPDQFISFAGNRADSFMVALVSGAIAAYGIVRPKVAAAITGVAIAVSLMPPLVATGIGLAPGGIKANDAFVLFLLNVLGILIASVVVFAWLNVGKVYRAMVQRGNT
jgi:uncharacterized hydrophobic protein (TIGR00271 family)